MSSPETAASVALNPNASEAERADAMTNWYASHVAGNADIAELAKGIREVLDEDDTLAKAGSTVVPFPSKNAKKPGMQSVDLDEYRISFQGEWWERPGMLSFDSMRLMVEQTPILNAIVMTRVRQVQRFCRVQESGQGLGFVIRHRDRDHKVTDEEKRSILLLQDFVSNCGWERNPRKRRALKRDNFATFMAKSVRDSLVLDSAPIETEMKKDRRLGIDGFYAVDGATIRLCSEDGYHGDDEIFALQVVQSRVRTAYTLDTMIYEPRNPRTDVLVGGYGLSEVELLIRIVTGWLNALSYNIKGFDSNQIPKGLLHLTGDFDQKDIDAFRRIWKAMVSGVQNAWALPVMVSKNQESKAAFENFGVEFNEMYFAKWMTFLSAVACAVYSMSPDEVNFEAFSAGNSSLSGKDTEEKLALSKDKGLLPLLAYYENTISDFIISDFSDKFVLRWTGLDDEDEKQRFEKDKIVLTVDEMRAQQGYDKHPDPTLGAAPVNPSLMSAYQSARQANQPQDFGDPDAPVGGGDPQDERENAYQGGASPDDAPEGGDAADFGKPMGAPDFGGGDPDSDLAKAHARDAETFGLPPIYHVEP